MTLEELQALSDAELNEISGIKIMGFADDADKEFFCWNPTSNMNDAMTLAGMAINASKYSDVTISIPACVVIFHRHTAEELIVDTEDSVPRAITIAAILAKESV